MYAEWDKSYTTNITNYQDSRMFDCDKKDLPENAHQGFWKEDGKTAVERYGLQFLSNDAVATIFREKDNNDSQGRPLDVVTRMVVGMMFRMMCLARTRTTKIRIGTDGKGKDVFITPSAKIPQALISTWDVGHSVESDKIYQENFTRLHKLRMVPKADPPAEDANPTESKYTVDAGIERLLQLGAFCPGLGWIDSRTVASRAARLPLDKREVVEPVELINEKHDDTLLPNKR